VGSRASASRSPVDGERVHLFDWDKEIANTTGRGKWTPKIPIKAGMHTVGVTFLATNDIPGTELNRPFQRTMNTPGSIPGFIFYPHVGQVTVEGPHDAKGASNTASLQKIFICKPAAAKDEDACARRNHHQPGETGVPSPGERCRT
jgi:hypothetical protein